MALDRRCCTAPQIKHVDVITQELVDHRAFERLIRRLLGKEDDNEGDAWVVGLVVGLCVLFSFAGLVCWLCLRKRKRYSQRTLEDFNYLGYYVKSVNRDIDERCKAASRAYDRLIPVWTAPLRLQTKLRVFKAIVEPVLFYAPETWPLNARREERLTCHRLRLTRQIMNRRWPRVRRSDESSLSELSFESPAQTLRERFLKHVGHAFRTSLRKTSAGFNLYTEAMGFMWIREHKLRYNQSGMVRLRRVQKRGKGKLCTLFRYCARLLRRRVGDSNELMDFAQRRETLRQLAESL
jgi:hypothetical protein